MRCLTFLCLALTAGLFWLLDRGPPSPQTPPWPLPSSPGLPGPNPLTTDLALDLIAVERPDGPVELTPIPRQSTVESLERWIEEQGAALGGSLRPVVLDKRSNRRELDMVGLATREVVIQLSETLSPDLLAKLIDAQYLGALTFAPDHHRYLCKSETEALTVAKRIGRHPGVRSVRPQIGRMRVRTVVPNDPLYGQQWHLRNTGQTNGIPGLDLNIETAWESVRGRHVVIGIVDDSLLTTHQDLSDNVDTALGYDYRDRDDDPSPNLVTPNAQDPHNFPEEDAHGTLVAGIAAARGFNGFGVTGVAPEARIVGIRLIGDYITDLQEAEAISHRHDVIAIKNNSWGPNDNGAVLSGPDELAEAALLDSVENGRGGLGTVFLWAAGNGGYADDNSNKNGYANSIHTIAVGALDDTGKRAAYSEIGPNILVTAPVGSRTGFGALTTDLPGDDGLNIAGYESDLNDPSFTTNFFGTSASTPMVSGVVALMLEANPALGWRDVQEILIRTARKVDESSLSWIVNGSGLSFSNEYGAGMVDASAAVDLARGWVNLGPYRSAARSLEQESPLGLPDGGQGSWEERFAFSGTGLRVEQATVRVFLDHAYRGELRFELESPSGTVSELVGYSDDDSRGYFD